MENKCPKCGNFLITKTIKKEMGHGSIEYPVSQMCPKCNWSKDLTGAGEIIPEKVGLPAEDIKKEVEKPVFSSPPVQPGIKAPGNNRIIIVALSILVLAAIGWAFVGAGPKQSDETTGPVPTPTVTVTPAATVATPTPVITEVLPTGNKTLVKLNYYRGFIPVTQKIKPGDEVVWENIDTDTVTLVSNEGLFDARQVIYGRRTNYTFKKSGTYGFHLKENKNLNGTIVVEP